jgi:hypothetical protein
LVLVTQRSLRELLQSRLAYALSQVLVGTGERLLGNGCVFCSSHSTRLISLHRPVSIRHGLEEMAGAVVDVVAALIGLSEMRPRYTSEVGLVAQALEKQHLFKQ